jgi:predicted NBD/HSP70 family sugar kinase
MTRAVKSLLAEARKGGLEVCRVGVGCAGDIDLKRGIVRHSPNLAFLDGYKLGDTLARLTERVSSWSTTCRRASTASCVSGRRGRRAT